MFLSDLHLIVIDSRIKTSLVSRLWLFVRRETTVVFLCAKWNCTKIKQLVVRKGIEKNISMILKHFYFYCFFTTTRFRKKFP